MDWKRVWIVARQAYLTHLKRAGFIIMTAIIPLLGALVLLIGFFFAGEARQIGRSFFGQFEEAQLRIGVVDRSGNFSPILPEYRDDFTLYPDEQQAEEALEAEQASQILIIESNYLESGKITVVTLGSGFDSVSVSGSDQIRSFLIDHLLQDEIEPILRTRIADPMNIEPRIISSSGTTQGEGAWTFVFNLVVPYILSMFLIMTIFMSSGYLLQSVAEEKENRVIEIIVSSIRPIELMAGKILGMGALGLTQVLVWVMSSLGFGSGAVALLAATGAGQIPASVLILGIVFYVLGYLLYAILMAGVGTLGATAQESQQLAGIFSLFAAIPYMLSGFLFGNANAPIARVLSFFPLTAPTMMLLRLPLAKIPAIDIAGSIVALLVAIPLALLGSTKLFRFGLLVYGKRPTLKEIWGIIRS
ncbi:MAG: ABC transporter permease [Anaerolineae bacterium]|nr:ABC transporter permease [Anaerolineae bacterium]